MISEPRRRRRCLGCNESLEGANPQRRWCIPCRRIRHSEQSIARQNERYRTDPEYRATKLARNRALRRRQRKARERQTPRRPWTDADDDALRKGYAAGTPASAIAAVIGRTETAVYTRASRLGLAEALRFYR